MKLMLSPAGRERRRGDVVAGISVHALSFDFVGGDDVP
jgi:hypothetical protein